MCPQCNKNKATHDREYGVLPCGACQLDNALIPKPSNDSSYDFASPTTKEQRKTHGDEMFQPWINGVLSREFVETYGVDRLAGITKKDIKNAKYVYTGMTRHHKMMQQGEKRKKELAKKPKDNYKVEEKN